MEHIRGQRLRPRRRQGTPQRPTADSDPNVDLELVKQGGVWVHTLTVSDVPCIPNCTYTWHCQTSTDFKTSTTAGNPKTFKTKVCAQ